MRLLVPSLKKPQTHFTSQKLVHKSILYCYAYNSTWKTIFCRSDLNQFRSKSTLCTLYIMKKIHETEHFVPSITFILLNLQPLLLMCLDCTLNCILIIGPFTLLNIYQSKDKLCIR